MTAAVTTLGMSSLLLSTGGLIGRQKKGHSFSIRHDFFAFKLLLDVQNVDNSNF